MRHTSCAFVAFTVVFALSSPLAEAGDGRKGRDKESSAINVA